MCDLTYIRTWVGFAYLALVVHVFSRRIVGWAVAGHMRTELPLEALELAMWTRLQSRLNGLIAPHRCRLRNTSRFDTPTPCWPRVSRLGRQRRRLDDNALAESTIGSSRPN